MIKFKFENQTVSLPEKWSEVSVGMFSSEHWRSGDPIKLLATLADIDHNLLYNTEADLTKYFVQVAKMMKDVNGYKGKPEVPITFKLLDIECKVPKDIEMRSFGQKIMYGMELAKKKYSEEVIPQAIAIYLAPQIYPDDWYERIDEVAEAVKELKVVDCYTLADFFLSDIAKHKRSITSSLPQSQ